jgi:hypothetical protein
MGLMNQDIIFFKNYLRQKYPPTEDLEELNHTFVNAGPFFYFLRENSIPLHESLILTIESAATVFGEDFQYFQEPSIWNYHEYPFFGFSNRSSTPENKIFTGKRSIPSHPAQLTKIINLKKEFQEFLINGRVLEVEKIQKALCNINAGVISATGIDEFI